MSGAPIATLTLEVAFDDVLQIGPGAAGNRGVAFITGGRLDGERIAASVLGGEDWFTIRADGSLDIDVRLTLHSDDEAFLTLAYQGRMTGTTEALAAFARREPMRRGDYAIETRAVIACGDPRYEWLDGLALAGTGTQTAAGPVYQLFAA